jgi:hypothetical protein
MDQNSPVFAGPLYSISSADSLHVIDPADGSIDTTVVITLEGETVVGGNGLATNPLTGELWAVLRLRGQTGRVLVTIDPATGEATSVGDTGDLFAGLAFDAEGTLYGVSGIAATPPNTLFILSTADATPESLVALRVLGGHAIAFNPGDGRIYHATGGTFECVDLDALTTTAIPASGDSWFAAQGLTHAGSDRFLLTSDFGKLYSLDSVGVADSLGLTDHSKGLAFGLTKSSGLQRSIGPVGALELDPGGPLPSPPAAGPPVQR